MTTIKLKGNEVHTSGDLPALDSPAPDFTMVNTDLSEAKLHELPAKKKILNIFPSLDTGVCAKSVRKFNEEAVSLDNTMVVNISKDLPFAQKRFGDTEKIENAKTASVFRSDFADKYGLEITDGPMRGLCSRVVIVLNENNKVLYTEQVLEITEEPNYDAALEAVSK